jgi:hypothetical protein
MEFFFDSLFATERTDFLNVDWEGWERWVVCWFLWRLFGVYETRLEKSI